MRTDAGSSPLKVVIASCLKVLAAAGLASIVGYGAVLACVKLGLLKAHSHKLQVLLTYVVVGLAIFILTLVGLFRSRKPNK